MNTRNFLRAALLLLVLIGLRPAYAAPAPWAGPPDWAGQPGGPRTPAYNALYVFGDSLSDTGNDQILTRGLGANPPIPPSTNAHRTYWEGRFSNGPVAAEYLWRELSRKGNLIVPSLAVSNVAQAPAISFAFGGSGSGREVMNPGGFVVPGLLSQVEMFEEKLQGRPASERALFMIWTGANDYIFDYDRNPASVVGNIVAAIQDLYFLGARNFLIPNLPDFSRSPLVQAQSQPEREGLAMLVKAHNAALAGALHDLAAALPGVRFFSPDTYALMNWLLDGRGQGMALGPALDYLAPGVDASKCLFKPDYPDSCPSVNLNRGLPPMMFWDVLHPTTQAHQLLGRAMYQSLR